MLIVTILCLFLTTPVASMQLDHFISELRDASPQHDGAPLRIYRTEDLDHDGELEVLEYLNPVEEEAVGFLNIELYPAFEWINVYRRKGDIYILADEEYPDLLRNRKAFYLSWLKRLENPSALGKDSQYSIQDNADSFKRTLNGYIDRIDGMLRSRPLDELQDSTKPARDGGKIE